MAAATLTLVSINSKAFDQRGRIVEKSTSPRKTDEIDQPKAKKMQITYRYRIKDRHAARLDTQARAVNLGAGS
jgi:hypothetical protein